MIHDVFTESMLKGVEKQFSDGWEQSRVGGVSGSDTTSSIRTSAQQWCRKECESKPEMQTIIERVESLLGVRRNNLEDMQILRYQPGQEYKEHHDFIEPQLAMACGP